MRTKSLAVDSSIGDEKEIPSRRFHSLPLRLFPFSVVFLVFVFKPVGIWKSEIGSSSTLLGSMRVLAHPCRQPSTFSSSYSPSTDPSSVDHLVALFGAVYPDCIS